MTTALWILLIIALLLTAFNLLRVGVAVYWCVVTAYWAWNVIERWIG